MALNDNDRDRDRALDRAYGAAVREEPPAHLDAAILAAARREAGARPRPLTSRLRSWRVPVSIAAVVVVSVSLVTMVREEGGDRLIQPGAPSPRSAEPPAPSSQPRPDRSEPPSPSRDSPAADDAAIPEQERGDRAARGPTSDTTSLGQAGPGSAGKAASEQPAAVPHPPSARPSESPLAKELGRGIEPGAPARSSRQAEESGPAADPPAGIRRQEAQRRGPALSRTDPGTRDQAAGQGAPAAESAAATAPRTSPAPAPAAKARSEPRLESRPGSGSPELAALLKEYDARPPRDWLGRIQELKRGGRPDLADAMLAEFKRRYPEHLLSPELESAP
jgi:hypothetical protein